MGLLHCPDCGTPRERVAEGLDSTPEEDEGKAGTVTGDFTVRCPKCETMDEFNDDNLRRQYHEAEAAKSSVVAGEIQEALEAWGFATG